MARAREAAAGHLTPFVGALALRAPVQLSHWLRELAEAILLIEPPGSRLAPSVFVGPESSTAGSSPSCAAFLGYMYGQSPFAHMATAQPIAGTAQPRLCLVEVSASQVAVSISSAALVTCAEVVGGAALVDPA